SKANAAFEAVDEEIARIEALISSWKATSQTSEINRQAGKQPVKVDQELFDLLYRSIKISQLTSGAYDPTYAGLLKIWNIDSVMQATPDSGLVAASVALVGYERMVMNAAEHSVFLPEQGMKIGFGGIGKGYAADRAKLLLQNLGISAGVVNAGGDLISWGIQPNGSPWRISIADPIKPHQILATLQISNKAVVTSGNYERFIEINGKRYAHILDPRTGWPVAGLKSVTIVTSIAEFADALATSIFVMGELDGLALVEQLTGVECLIVTDDNRMISSSGLDLKELGNRD
ncbi:MAG: FAD:protein FMN transferase, partial [Bacteroidia bacterium]|nr:FAD:protein FMN transferase [Bacteroidia bacterium]